jgi:enoyl-CoA hydratase/carnithine racemase
MMTASLKSSGHIRFEREGHLAIIGLARPQRRNALSAGMLSDLGEAFLECGQNPDIRAIVMLADGDSFCVGGDLDMLRDLAAVPTEQQLVPAPRFTARQVGIFKPTVCAINGMCAGAGLHFVADSDIVIASEKALFTDTHVNVGQVTALEPIGLARRIPLGWVLRMVILGKAERLSAQDAYRLGMVTEITTPDGLVPRAIELAQIAARVSPQALQQSLKAIWRSLELPLAEAYRRGYEDLVRHRAHPDALEGPGAFLEKREPRWALPWGEQP